MSDQIKAEEKKAQPPELDMAKMMFSAFNVAIETSKDEGKKPDDQKKEEEKKAEPEQKKEEKKAEPSEPQFLSIELPQSKPEQKQDDQKQAEKTEVLSAEDMKAIEALPEDEREQVELALFAESSVDKYKGTGLAKKMLEGIKKATELRAKADTMDEEELQRQLESAIPEIKPAERERLWRKMVEQRAEERAQMKISNELNLIKSKQAEIELAPALDSATKRLVDIASGAEAKLPEGVEPIDVEAFKAPDARPVEGEVIKSSVEAAKEYVKIAKGATQYNDQNITHAWLADFIYSQGESMVKRGVTIEGRKFVHRQDYAKMSPQERSSHFTFTDDDVIKMIGVNAVIAVNRRYKDLEKSGFVRKKVSTNGETGSTAKIEDNEPKGGVKPTAPAAGGATNTEAGEFIEKLVPGASKRIVAA